MNDLQQFTSAQFGDIRALSIDGEPWFVGKDVAQVLGYSNTKDALSRHVDPEDKGVNEIGCVKGGMGYWNKIRKDFPEVFERMAKLEREIGHSCINGVYLDELEPHRGRIYDEVMQECGILCYLALNE